MLAKPGMRQAKTLKEKARIKAGSERSQADGKEHHAADPRKTGKRS